MYRASQAIKRIVTSAGKEISIEYVTKTDAWERTYIAPEKIAEFAAIAEKYKDTLKATTEKVAIK